MIFADNSSCTGLFEGDQDLDLLSDINHDVFKHEEPDETNNAKTDNPEQPDNGDYELDESKDLLLGDAAAIRAKLDAGGTGDALFSR